MNKRQAKKKKDAAFYREIKIRIRLAQSKLDKNGIAHPSNKSNRNLRKRVRERIKEINNAKRKI